MMGRGPSLSAVVIGLAVAAAGPSPAVVATGVETVVVAQFDTGINPFHPCFARPGADPSAIPTLHDRVRPLELTLRDDYEDSLWWSEEALAAIEPGALHHVVGTNILYRGSATGLVDAWPHGSQAASQVVCREYGLAPEAWIVVLNWYESDADRAGDMAWVADQPWIDVVHLNIQDLGPVAITSAWAEGIAAMRDSGKYVVIAAGNGVYYRGIPYPAEAARTGIVPGTHLAGANDGSGYASYSNLDPHTVMDGVRTRAASPDSYDEVSFGGTSSASPRTAGYVARALQLVRRAVGRGGGPGVLVDGVDKRPWGPLDDGRLTAEELFEAVRRTADPLLGADPAWDGEQGALAVPRPAALPPGSDYSRVGYGKLTTLTLDHLVDVLLGNQPAPERPWADRFFLMSETFRGIVHG